jgi:hypothetical protein
LVGDPSGKIYEIWGDKDSPTNRGGLCAKGAGSYQLVTNRRRLGVADHTSIVDGFDFSGTAWKRTGNGAWTNMTLDAALTELAPKLVDARDRTNILAAKTTGTTFKDAGGTSFGPYYGFFGPEMVKNDRNGLYYVQISAAKMTYSAFQSAISGLSGLPLATALANGMDQLWFEARNPWDYTTYTFKGAMDVARILLTTTGVPMHSGQITFTKAAAVADDAYYCYAADATGGVHRLYSKVTVGNGLAWAYDASLGAPGGAVSGVCRPFIVPDGTGFHLFSGGMPSGVMDGKIYYAHNTDGTSTGWDVATTALTGPFTSGWASDPWVTGSGTVADPWVMYYTATTLKKVKGNGLTNTDFSVGDTLVRSPEAGGHTIEYVNRFGVSGTAEWFVYSTYVKAVPTDPIDWAYGDIHSYAPVSLAIEHNARSVQFFGSSHMNNEPNYLYRKVIADFGTSCVEHQARI